MADVRMSHLIREFGAYGAASVVALLTDMGLLAVLVSKAHVHYLVAATISFVCGGVLLYVLSVTLVFRFRRIEHRGIELSWFVALGAVGLLVNAGVIYVAVAVGGLHFMVGKLLAAGCTFCTNFLLRRHFLFSPVAPPDVARAR